MWQILISEEGIALLINWKAVFMRRCEAAPQGCLLPTPISFTYAHSHMHLLLWSCEVSQHGYGNARLCCTLGHTARYMNNRRFESRFLVASRWSTTYVLGSRVDSRLIRRVSVGPLVGRTVAQTLSPPLLFHSLPCLHVMRLPCGNVGGVFHSVSLKGRLKRKSLHGFSVSHAALHGVWQVGLWGRLSWTPLTGSINMYMWKTPSLWFVMRNQNGLLL